MDTLRLYDIEQQQLDDLRWAASSHEMRQYAGQLVAVHKKRVVGVGADRKALVTQAAEKAQCPCQDLVVVVVPGADFSEVPH